MTIKPLLLDRLFHAEALEKLSLDALSSGDAMMAFRYADRRCKLLPRVQAYHYLLRAEALHRLDEFEHAVDDVAFALELKPDDLTANRRMLTWGSGDAQRASARRLIAEDTNLNIVAEAISVLTKSGERDFASVRATDTHIFGWIAWSWADCAELEITDDEGELVHEIAGSPDHPLARIVQHAANFSIRRPRTASPQQVTLRCGEDVIMTVTLRPNGAPEVLQSRNETVESKTKAEKITVIVPIYRDFEATRNCLELVAGELDDSIDAIVINDASPDEQIRSYLRGLAHKSGFAVLENEKNLGFVGSVNRALAHAAPGDVVFLNSDTLPPPGFVEQLSAAAHVDPSIGTVTPLSNHGEFTSFPLPFKQNELPELNRVLQLDGIARTVNHQRVVDLPSGIGFCMYVTQACRDTVGNLSDTMYRGYLEDVDFCLRAREFGFRNVCAPSVFVGHAGSRSFGDEKRSLVVRNLGPLELRHPGHRHECAAFMLADPLKPYRAAIERKVLPADADILVCGSGLLRAVAEGRADVLRKRGRPSIIMTVEFTARGSTISMTATDGNVPQSLTFDLSSWTSTADFRSYLTELRPARFEIIDPAGVPEIVRDIIAGQKVTIDVLIADAGLICPRGTLVPKTGTQCGVLSGEGVCSDCIVQSNPSRQSLDHWRANLKRMLGRATTVIAPTEEARLFANSSAWSFRHSDYRPADERFSGPAGGPRNPSTQATNPRTCLAWSRRGGL